MKTKEKAMSASNDSKLRQLLFNDENTNRRIAIKKSEKIVEEDRVKDLINNPSSYLHTLLQR